MTDAETKLNTKWDGLKYGVLGVMVLTFGLIIFRTAWLCDDAFITFRTADNFIHGYGLRWNADERVQSFTHPLWLAVCIGTQFFTREAFLTPMFTAMLVSIAAVGVLAFGLARGCGLGFLAVVMLTCSRAFVDYSTSGLENPLSHVLLAIFLIIYFRAAPSPKTLFYLSLVATLGVLNRMDLALIFAPAVIYAWLCAPSLKGLAAILLGGTPFVAWEIFSVIYYGFPFPNTAYAKLGTGISSHEMLFQGLCYFGYSLHRDIITLAIIGAALLISLLRRDRKAIAAALGILLYCLYIIRIGGDFMGGRFLTVPLFFAVALLCQLPFERRPLLWLAAIITVVTLSIVQPGPPFLTGADYGKSMRNFADAHGVGDERLFYFQVSSLSQWAPGKEMPTHTYAKGGREYRRADKEVTKVHGSVGFRGYFAGPKVHIIDYYALADILLARLPAKCSPNWRIGHFLRDIPAGYEQSAGPGINAFTDKNLGQYYEHLVRITRGPIWNFERWITIWNMNRGAYDGLIDVEHYRFPNLKKTVLTDINKEVTFGANAGERKTPVPIGGLQVALGELAHSSRISIRLDGTDRYRILFMRGNEILGKVEAGPGKNDASGLAQYEALVPKAATARGFDAIRVFPYSGDKKYTVGKISFM